MLHDQAQDQFQQILYLRVRSQYGELASRFSVLCSLGKLLAVMKVDELDPIGEEKLEGTQVLV